MRTQTMPITATQKKLKFANGTVLEVGPFVGTAAQWTTGAGTFRSPAEEDLSVPFREAMRELGVVEQETLHLDVTPVATASRGLRTAAAQDKIVMRPVRPAGAPEGVNVVLYQDEAGGLSWHFPDGFFEEPTPLGASPLRGRLRTETVPTFTIPTRTAAAQQVLNSRRQPTHLRGPITKWGRKIFKVLLLPVLETIVGPPLEAIVGKIEKQYRQELIRAVTPENYRTSLAEPFRDWTSLEGKPSLLIVHGIFSSSHGMLSGLPQQAMAELHAHYGGRVIALDQITVSRSPEENARFFLETVRREAPTGQFEFDILCHSRGGIVSRTLVERGDALVPGHNCSFRNAFFVATPNRGSLLADPDHIVDMLDVFTNLLTSFPDGPVTYSIEVLLAIVKLLAHTAERRLPGLAAMGTRGYIADVLNLSTAHAPAAYAAAASDYTPAPNADSSLFTGSLANSVVDRIFTENGRAIANDLVVPRDGVFVANGHPSFPIARPLIFSTEAGVPHTGFFQRPETITAIKAHFGIGQPGKIDLEQRPGSPSKPTPTPSRPPRRRQKFRGGGSVTKQPPKGESIGGELEVMKDGDIGDGSRTPLPTERGAPIEEAGRPRKTPEQPKPVELQREPKIDFHEQVREGEPNNLRVRLDEALAQSAAAPLLLIPLPVGQTSAELFVTLSAPGFDVEPLGDSKVTVRTPRDPATEHVDFRLTARHLGPQPARREIRADFWLGNSPLGSVTHRTFVLPKNWTGPGPADGSSVPFQLRIPTQPREECEFTIFVEGEDETGQPPLEIRIRSEIPGHVKPLTRASKLVLDSPGNTLAGYLDTIYSKEFSLYPPETLGDNEWNAALTEWEENFNAALDALGKKLWKALPQTLRDEYFRLYRAQALPRSILIYSDEMILPWELVVPHEMIDGKLVTLEPLGTAHILGRLKPGLRILPEPQRLEVRNFCVLNPRYAGAENLAWAQDEVNELQKLLPRVSVVNPAKLAKVRTSVLDNGDIQLLHFSGHGQYDPTNSDLSSLVLEDLDLDAALITGSRLAAEGQPLIYLNACSVGQTGMVIGRMGGFAANFLESGASGVIAPYWPIHDDRAKEFSLALYHKLRCGRAVGEALQELRQDHPRDSTFRAFAYFGDPWARTNLSLLSSP